MQSIRDTITEKLMPLTDAEIKEAALRERRRIYMAKYRDDHPGYSAKICKRYYDRNAEKRRLESKAYHEKNRDSEEYKIANRKRVKAWREKFPERSKAAIKLARKKPAGRLANNACRRKERQRRPELLIKCRVRARVAHALKGIAPKSNTTEGLIGCTFSHLREYIESLFEPGMSWENRHLWHVDHIRPCASFNLLDPEQQRCCFHYSNLQPLWAKDNLAKADKCL